MITGHSTSPWINMNLDAWSPLLVGRTSKHFVKKQSVYHQENSSATIYVVKSGRVCITSYQLDGMEKHMYIAEQGCLFGENSCMLHNHHLTSAIAIVDSSIYCIPLEEFEISLQNNWALTQQFIVLICRKNIAFQQQILELSFAQALQRIARALINLGDEYGVSHPDGIGISIRFTHQDIANITNASRVTVSNVFGSLGDEGMIKKVDGHFVLTNVAALSKYADGTMY